MDLDLNPADFQLYDGFGLDLHFINTSDVIELVTFQAETKTSSKTRQDLKFNTETRDFEIREFCRNF